MRLGALGFPPLLVVYGVCGGGGGGGTWERIAGAGVEGAAVREGLCCATPPKIEVGLRVGANDGVDDDWVPFVPESASIAGRCVLPVLFTAVNDWGIVSLVFVGETGFCSPPSVDIVGVYERGVAIANCRDEGEEGFDE